MSYTINMRTAYQEGSDTAGLDQTVAVTCDAVDKRDLTITTGTTDQQVLIAFTLASLKAYCFVSDQAITIKTNSSSVPDDTITLVANEPLAWHNLNLHAKKFTQDVTTLYVTNSSGQTATVRMRVGKDSTP